MPFSLSHIHFMRRLSIQPEENGVDMDDEDNGKLLDDPFIGKGSEFINDPDDLPLIPCMALGSEKGSSHDDLRKLSVASIISIRSSSSLSSTCSAPGLISSSVGRSGFHPSYTPQSESCDAQQPMTKRLMTSRPSFISLCSIVSETSEAPQRLLPAPLQVELDLMQRSGIEGDEPKCRSHLPILRCPSDYDISEMEVENTGSGLVRRNSKKGLVKGIREFPRRIRKMSTESHRFDIYSVSDEVREQLKSLYVY